MLEVWRKAYTKSSVSLWIGSHYRRTLGPSTAATERRRIKDDRPLPGIGGRQEVGRSCTNPLRRVFSCPPNGRCVSTPALCYNRFDQMSSLNGISSACAVHSTDNNPSPGQGRPGRQWEELWWTQRKWQQTGSKKDSFWWWRMSRSFAILSARFWVTRVFNPCPGKRGRGREISRRPRRPSVAAVDRHPDAGHVERCRSGQPVGQQMAADSDTHHVGTRDAGKLWRPARGYLYSQTLELWSTARRCRQGAAKRQGGLGISGRAHTLSARDE